MRKTLAFVTALALCLLAPPPVEAATGITIQPNVRYEFTDCAAGGSAAQTVTAGTYVFRVTDSDVFVCYAATCAAGGEKWPLGTVILINVNADQSVSCRSAGSTGDAIFTRGG